MKSVRLFVSVISRVFAFVACFVGDVVAVVASVSTDVWREFKAFVGVCDHMLSHMLVMMYSASVSGAVHVGNKLFGSVVVLHSKPVPWQRTYA